jgi:dihydroflavonol-4-reductase
VRVLVTGANGLLGSNLCRELLAAGHRVRGMVRGSSDTRGIDGLDVERVTGDARNAADLRAAVDGCEVVYHTAAVFSYWGFDHAEMYDTARDGAKNLCDAAKDAGVRRVVLTSTCAILGGKDTPAAVDESARPDMSDYPDYFKSKLVQEDTAIARARELGLELVAANPSTILGPYDFKPSASLPSFLAFITGPMQFTMAGGVDYVHAADVARGQMLLAEKGRPYERHILASGQNLDWRQIHGQMCKVAGLKPPSVTLNRATAYASAWLMELGARLTKRPPLATVELAKQMGRYFWYDPAKSLALGFRPRSLEDTLVDTLAWLFESPHLSDRQKRKLHPLPSVVSARERYRSRAAA